jgi:serine/threonine protein kinase
MFNRQDVDASIVRYLQSTEIDQIPSIITSTHEGFATYSTLQDDIRKSHPGVRFAIATKLFRRLFSALAFLHFNGIVHGHVSNDSVLL